MGRRGGGGSRSPPRRPAPPPRHAAPPPRQAPPPVQQHAAPAPAPSSGMGGGMGGMLMQGAALGAGSAVGHMAVSSMFGGGGGGHQQAPPPQQEAAPVQGTTNYCQEYDQMFQRCMANSNNDMDNCNLVYKDLETCRRQYGMM